MIDSQTKPESPWSPCPGTAVVVHIKLWIFSLTEELDDSSTLQFAYNICWHYLHYEIRLESVSLSCKSHHCKTLQQMSKFYSRTANADASDHIYYVSQWPVINVKASFCTVAHVNERSHSFTCHPRVYPQVEWTIPAFTPSRRASPPFGRYSFYRPMEGRRLSWPRWLVTYRNIVPPPGVKPRHGHSS